MKISTPADWDFAGAWQVAEAIRKHLVSSVEITSNVLYRQQKLNPKINAIVTELGRLALDRAQKADAALARHENWGCLHGVPCTVRDTFETAGIRTTAGLRGLRDYIPRQNASVVTRLLAAGAVIVGKTNTSALGRDWQTYNDLFGVTNNPWDLTRTPGGSSGGCAAAVAAGLSYLSIGSDLGGSIRIPAAFCGVFGHKPSLDLVPSDGHIPPYPGRPRPRSSLGVRGPIARDPADLMLALEVLGRLEYKRRAPSACALPPARRSRISDYKIGFVLDDPLCRVAPEIVTTLYSVISELRRSGAKLQHGWPSPLIPQQQHKPYRCLLDGLGVLRRETFHKTADRGSEIARAATAPNWVTFKSNLFSGLRKRLAARQLWQDFFQTYDAFLLPTVFVPAFCHDHSEPWDQRWLQSPQGPQPYLGLAFWTSFATLAGLPATVAPVGFTKERLPIGIQIIGPYFQDATPIDLASRISHMLGGFQPASTG